jgi:hypothetical protein
MYNLRERMTAATPTQDLHRAMRDMKISQIENQRHLEDLHSKVASSRDNNLLRAELQHMRAKHMINERQIRELQAEMQSMAKHRGSANQNRNLASQLASPASSSSLSDLQNTTEQALLKARSEMEENAEFRPLQSRRSTEQEPDYNW